MTMIRRLLEKDKEHVLSFLYNEPEINLYIIADIQNYGFDSDIVEIYAEFKNNDYFAVMSRNLNYITFYQLEGDFNTKWVDIFHQKDFYFISGKFPVIKRFHPYFKDMFDDKMDFMRSTEFHIDRTLDLSDIQILKTKEDAAKVYDFLNSIEELHSVHKQTKEEYIDYLMHNSHENGTTCFIEREGEVIASASAVMETRKSAMVVGVASHANFRGEGLGKKVMHYLLDYYVNKKNKTLCLYYDDPIAEKLYKSYGFEDIDRWIMLLKHSDEKTSND